MDETSLPEGWWSGLTVPDPQQHRRTGTLSAAGVRVEIWNGTSELESLVRWALDRFRAAGLEPPEPASVTFVPASHDACSGAPAVSHGQSLTEITLCFGVDEACPAPDCPPYSLRSRRLVLHELAHTWLQTRLTEQQRSRYGEVVGLRWWAPDEPRERRAVERAAETITWGLVGEHLQSSELHDVPDAAVAEEFRLLTGREPLPVG
jgi:hypothetical protein